MRMLLASGLVGPVGAVHDAVVGLLDRPIAESRVVVLLDAMLPLPGDKSTMLEHLAAFRALGWMEFDILTLRSGPPSLVEERLRSADLIFGYGGSNHALAAAWRESGLASLLPELLEQKVYLGMSAGSMVFARGLAAATEALDDHGELEMLGLTETAPALPLFDWHLVPHLGASFFPHATDAWAAEVAPHFGAPTWFLDDASALLIRDPATEPEPVSDGHWLRFDADGGLVSRKC